MVVVEVVEVSFDQGMLVQVKDLDLVVALLSHIMGPLVTTRPPT